MPFGDGTGPRGMGPMTGRGAGYCPGFARPGIASRMPGMRWLGRGFRPWGRGGNRFFHRRGFSPRTYAWW
jgi:hypothetical protein